jgi:predicted amidohydrolase
MLIYVANWPAARCEVWKTLLKARAIENQCYVVGVNRIGEDGMKISYTGDSMVIDPKGNVISEIVENKEGFSTITLSLSELQNFKEKFPVHLDADNFKIMDID